MEMLHKWIYVFSLFHLLGTFKEVQGYNDYCEGNTPVVNICQESSVEDQSVVYVNSGGVPKYQVFRCTCDIIKPNAMPLQFTLVNNTNLNDDIKFSINEWKLDYQRTVSGTWRLYYFFYRNDTTDRGGCVKIKRITGGNFSVNCEANGNAITNETDDKETKEEGTDFGETVTEETEPLGGDPDSGDDNIAAAIGGAVGFIALVVCVAFCIVLGRKRKSSSTAGNANNTQDNEDPTSNYGLQPYPAYEQYQTDRQIKKKCSMKNYFQYRTNRNVATNLKQPDTIISNLYIKQTPAKTSSSV